MSTLPAHLLILLLLALPCSVEARTVVVDTKADDPALTACDDAVSDDCSLRGAIAAANAAAEHYDIQLPSGTYATSVVSFCTFLSAYGGNDSFSATTLCINKDVAIIGSGADTTIIDGLQSDRVIALDKTATATISGVTITRGVIPNVGTFIGGGGGILNHGTLALADVGITANTGGPGGGGGIFNAGKLTVVRSTIAYNVTIHEGGGIYNQQQAILTVSDSTITNDTCGGNGGGILNNQGSVTITNSTVRDNTAGYDGGGITNWGGNFIGTLMVINSTISGNTTGGSGGGINGGNVTDTHLNNVTITNNTGATDHGGGGGVYGGGTFTVRNTVIGGNHDAGTVGVHDCSGTLISQGHNLIQTLLGCTITGDTTGNITGVDPKLGVLADNGGFTQTHGLSDGSPAIDAGNPAAPGSGGFACAALDQRGIPRPQGIVCDIGAYERFQGESSLRILPHTGGNTGSVMAIVYGFGVANGGTVKLRRAGQPDILGDPVASGGTSILSANFSLAGKPTGAWDVVVTNPGGTSVTLPGGFTIEDARAPQLWVDVIGLSQVSVGRAARFTLLFGNRSNVDAVAASLVLTVPTNIGLNLRFSVMPPPPHSEQVATDWSQVPVATQIDGLTYVSLLLPIVPAGFTQALEVTVTAPLASLGVPFEIRAELGLGSLDSQVALLIDGAHAYAQRVLGVDLPPSLTPQLEQYVTTQLQSVVERGRNAMVASVGTSTGVYSLRQLVIDLAQFGAARTIASAQTVQRHLLASKASDVSRHAPQRQHSQMDQTLPPTTGWVTALARLVSFLLQPSEAYAVTQGECAENGLAYDPRQHRCIPEGCGRALGGGGPCSGGGSSPTPVGAKDPNDKVGSRGAGTAQYLTGNEPLRYSVFFENVESATAPAQEVIITDQLDGAKVDFASFSLGPIGFADKTVTPPPGLSQYSMSVDLRPAQSLIVGIDARLDKGTGVLTWRFTSIDPDTRQFTEDPLAGFLPPNVTPPEGDGSVVFTVQRKPGLATDTQICNRASIVFDVNAAIETPQWCNRIDTAPPVTAVDSMVAGCSGALSLHWSGSDGGAGLDTFTIFVSEGGGPAVAWLADTTDTSGVYPGQPGKTYAFFSVASDKVGNVEDPPASPDVVVTPAMGCCTMNVECADGNPCNGDETCDGATGGCVAGAPLVCADDGNPCTATSCVPATGCTQTPISPCPAACAVECPDDDPCTADECVDGTCTRPEVTGTAGARCVCQRPPADACAGQSVPDKVGKKTAAACRALDRAVAATKAKLRKRLLKKAANGWRAAGRSLGKPAVTTALSPECLKALETAFADAATRAIRATTTP